MATYADFCLTVGGDALDVGTLNVKVERFTLSVKGKELFSEATLALANGRKYGLVGPNGCGKTTLLRYIADRKFAIPRDLDLLLCEQEVSAADTTVVNAVLEADERRSALLRNCVDADPDKLEELYEELTAIDADSAESKAKRILAGLGFTNRMMERSTKTFSGGWRMRVSLARALFLEPTLLLLDEPTNHLDLNAVIWLDSYLQNWKKTLLVVSHDRSFLDDVCTDTIHVADRKLDYYRGNYTTFEKMLVQKRKARKKAFESREKRLKALKAAGTIRKTARESTLVSRPKEYAVKFTFPEHQSVDSVSLGLDDVSFGYDNNVELFRNVNFGIDAKSRIAVVGSNGVGKSTFLKLLVGKITPTAGERITHRGLRIGEYSQHSEDQLNVDVSAVEYLMTEHNLAFQDARRMLGRFGLPSHSHGVIVKDLSGGQKSRVALADVACGNPNVLVLDEPTNNLDIETIGALIEAINAFRGGVVIVSHDERLIRESGCILWVIEDSAVREFYGDFEDYRNEVLSSLN